MALWGTRGSQTGPHFPGEMGTRPGEMGTWSSHFHGGPQNFMTSEVVSSEKWHVTKNFKFAVTGKIILFPDR